MSIHYLTVAVEIAPGQILDVTGHRDATVILHENDLSPAQTFTGPSVSWVSPAERRVSDRRKRQVWELPA